MGKDKGIKIFPSDTKDGAEIHIRLNTGLASIGWKTSSFDTRMLGVKAGIVDSIVGFQADYHSRLSALNILVDALMANTAEHGIEFLSARVPEGALSAAHALENYGFRVVECLVSLVCETPKLYERRALQGFITRGYTDELDRAMVLDIGDKVFTTNRIHVDPHFPDGVANAFRKEWVKNNLDGRADYTYIAKETLKPNPDVVGFLCLKDNNGFGIGKIDMVGVRKDMQNKGLGGQLVASAINYFIEKGTSGIEASTQAKNYPAIAMYQRAGFKITGSSLTFHWHRGAV